MADWDTSAPQDNARISQYPANERAARSAVESNFGVDHEETVGDADIGKHKQVTLPERGGDPSASSDEGTLYTKNVSGTTEVFYRDAAGNVVQVSVGGRIRGQLVPQVKTSDYTAVAGDCVLVDKSGGNVTVTLPASPSLGDEPISVTHINGTSNTLTIGRNGNPIMGLSEDMELDDNYASVVLYWGGSSPGWRLGILG